MGYKCMFEGAHFTVWGEPGRVEIDMLAFPTTSGSNERQALMRLRERLSFAMTEVATRLSQLDEGG